MHKMAKQQSSALLTARKLAERFNICTKTVDRWVEAGILSEPVRIRGRKYWSANTEPRRDGEAAGNTAPAQ